MSKKRGSKTPVPDPVAISNAQSAANTSTAQEQAALNRVNTSDPYGSVQWQQDPTTGQWSQNTTLNPQYQDQLGQLVQAQNGAMGALGSSNIDLGSLPGLQSTFGGDNPIKMGVDPYGQIQNSIGPTDFTADREAVTNAVTDQAMSRLNPMFDQQNTALQNQLANQGISINSAAYGNATDGLGRTQNDARNQAIYSGIQQGANEQNTLFNQDLQQGQFANAAQAQGYGQNLSSAQFANTAQQQGYNQAFERAQFQNQARAQGLSEQQAQDAYNLQRYAALSGSQVQMPNAISYTPTQIAPTDVTGAYALQQQAQNANAQRAQSQTNGLMGGLFSLGAAALAPATGGLSLAAAGAAKGGGLY
jgi:hypothetical protein